MAASNNTNNFQSGGVQQTDAGTATTYGGGFSATDASGSRLAGAGLFSGAVSAFSQAAGKVFNINFNAADGTPISPEADWRVRVSLSAQMANYFYSNPANAILGPLRKTSGVVFPYTPSITVAHAARYGSQPLTHSNYNSYFYEVSEVAAININADFTVQNVIEGQYLMAVIHFFRTVTKMFFGNEINAGSPPPLVFLDGYGPAYLPHVPCVVTSFSHTMPAEVDYVPIPVGFDIDAANNLQPIGATNVGGAVRLPTTSSVSLTLQPVYSRNNVSRFTLQGFSRGDLIQNGTSPIGGFI